MATEDFDVIFKIVIVGESGVGKSNLVSRYLKNEYKQDTKATVGVEFGEKKYTYNNIKIKAQIWDTAGQERYRSITSMYYKGAKGALCVFDLSSKESFEKVDVWINEMKKQAGDNINLILIGNKVDLPEDQKKVKTEEGEMKAKQFGIDVEAVGAEWDEIYPNQYSQGVLWGYGSTDPSDMYGEYYSSSDFNPARVNNSAVDSHMDAAFSESREDSYKDWSAVVWDGTTGTSPKGDANWLWLGEIKYGYFVNERVDISNDTALLQPHGGDLFSNIYDWTMTNSTA